MPSNTGGLCHRDDPVEDRRVGYALRPMVRCLLILILVSPGLVAASDACRPIGGVERLLRPSQVLLLGEIHGTEESPAFALDVACHAVAAGLPVVMGLELNSGDQGRVDAFLASQGTDDDRVALLASNQWQRTYQDGRNSRAMAALVEGLRQLRAEGAVVRVVMFDAPARQGGQQRDRDMGRNLAAAARESPGAMMIVLTGNNHSRIRRGSRRNAEYEPMGYVMAREISSENVIALNVAYGGGSAWICGPDCGVIELSGRFADRPWSIEIEESTRPPGHSGWYRVGAITASPPARMSDAEAAQVMSRVSPPTASRKVREDTEAVNPKALPDAPGPLFPAELRFQGSWQGYDYSQSHKTWAFWIEGRGFRAEGGPDEWYEGRIKLDTGQDPAWIDFIIDDCACAYKGGVSTGVFEWAGDSILISAPTPDDPRPERFDASGGDVMRLVRVDGIGLVLGDP